MSTLTKEWLEQNLETKLREQLAKNPQLRTPNDAKILCEGGLSQGHIKYFTVHMQDISVMAERKKFISGGMPAAAYHAEITMDGNCYKFPETGYWDIFDGRPKMVYKIMQTIDNEYVEKLCPLDYNSARVHDYILYPDANNPFQICDSTYFYLVKEANTTTDPDKLRAFATHPHCNVRAAAAGNKNTPQDLFCGEKTKWIFSFRHGISAKTVPHRGLVNDDWYVVRIPAIRNPYGMTPKTIRLVAENRFDVLDHGAAGKRDDSDFIAAMLSNPTTPKAINDRFMTHPDCGIQVAAGTINMLRNINKDKLLDPFAAGNVIQMLLGGGSDNYTMLMTNTLLKRLNQDNHPLFSLQQLATLAPTLFEEDYFHRFSYGYDEMVRIKDDFTNRLGLFRPDTQKI